MGDNPGMNTLPVVLGRDVIDSFLVSCYIRNTIQECKRRDRGKPVTCLRAIFRRCPATVTPRGEVRVPSFALLALTFEAKGDRALEGHSQDLAKPLERLRILPPTGRVLILKTAAPLRQPFCVCCMGSRYPAIGGTILLTGVDICNHNNVIGPGYLGEC